VCGIAGAVSGPGQPPVDLEELQRMVALLGHRGPDGHGLFRDKRVGLAHARLSIIDLTGGFQPLSGCDQAVWLCFNGEIFNYVELRRDLAALGHTFTTEGDSEVIVHCYEQYGPGAWAMLNGQFAFALWDRRADRLWLVRDRVGILPLHWARAGSGLVFASEAKALFAGGRVTPEVDPAGLAEIFTRWSAAAPRTAFAGVHSVRPGTALRVDARDLSVAEERYWQPDLSVSARWDRASLDDAADELGARLSEAVALRLRADVPVGAYLSGGLDSSVIGSLVRAGDSSLLQTFAVRFADPAFDETPEQRRMAGLLGTEHHEITCGPEQIQQALLDVVWHCETPLLRTAPVPLFLLSGLVRDTSRKVVLTGEGADELLGGYSIFKEDAVRRFWAREPGSGLRQALLGRLHPEVQAGDGRSGEMWRRFFGRDLTATDHPFYSHRIRWQNTGWSTRLLAPELRSVPAADADAVEADLLAEMPPGWLDWSPLARAQWIEIATFMSSYLLVCQGDRVAMAHGVEVRYPFLDPGVIDFCAGLPSRLKMPGLRDKVALRHLASRTLPPEIWQRPKKPYRAPMATELFGADQPDYVSELLSDAAVDRLGLVDPKASRLLLDRARARGGHMAGEREEMALVGALTLQALGQAYLVDFPGRAAEARRRLAAEPQVLVDLAGEGGDGAPLSTSSTRGAR
jgi:asparagine synthase (glutamine-hydrolysing)